MGSDNGSVPRPETWDEKVVNDLAKYGYKVIEIKDDGVVCETRSGDKVCLEYKKGENG